MIAYPILFVARMCYNDTVLKANRITRITEVPKGGGQ